MPAPFGDPVSRALAAPFFGLSEMRLRTLESEFDRFEISLLDSGHFVLSRVHTS